MATNDFLVFGGGSGANVMSQADWLALAQRASGFQSGVAQSAQLNKAWRQSSIMAAAIGQLIADVSGQNVVDDGTMDAILTNLKAAVSAQSNGIVGTARNAKMSVGSASVSATFTADELIAATGLGGLTYRLGNFSKTINLATTGAGGMDAGTAPTSGYVALYAIYNPANGDSALLGANATSAVAPEIYSGANMPAGYTASALVSVWGTTASGQFVVGYQTGRSVNFAPQQVLSAGAATANSSISLSGVVPKNAKVVYPNMTCQPGTAGNGYFLVADPTTQIGLRAVASPVAGGVLGVSCAPIQIITAQTLYYRNNVASSQATLVITGYEV